MTTTNTETIKCEHCGTGSPEMSFSFIFGGTFPITQLVQKNGGWLKDQCREWFPVPMSVATLGQSDIC